MARPVPKRSVRHDYYDDYHDVYYNRIPSPAKVDNKACFSAYLVDAVNRFDVEGGFDGLLDLFLIACWLMLPLLLWVASLVGLYSVARTSRPTRKRRSAPIIKPQAFAAPPLSLTRDLSVPDRNARQTHWPRAENCSPHRSP